MLAGVLAAAVNSVLSVVTSVSNVEVLGDLARQPKRLHRF